MKYVRRAYLEAREGVSWKVVGMSSARPAFVPSRIAPRAESSACPYIRKDMAQLYFISKVSSYGEAVLHICVSKYFISYSSIFSTAINASDGTDTVPKVRMRFLPSFCFSSSFFFRVISPP